MASLDIYLAGRTPLKPVSNYVYTGTLWIPQGGSAQGYPIVEIADSSGALLDYSGSTPVAGDVAHDAADSGNPIKVGGRAATTNPAAVADGDRVNAMYTVQGKAVTAPFGPRELLGDQHTAFTSTTSVTTIVDAVASVFLDLISLTLTNKSATGTLVELYDDDGTTVRDRFYAPPTDTRGIVFSAPFKQPVVNKTWKLKTVTSIDSLYVTAQFVKNV